MGELAVGGQPATERGALAQSGGLWGAWADRLRDLLSQAPVLGEHVSSQPVVPVAGVGFVLAAPVAQILPVVRVQLLSPQVKRWLSLLAARPAVLPRVPGDPFEPLLDHSVRVIALQARRVVSLH